MIKEFKFTICLVVAGVLVGEIFYLVGGINTKNSRCTSYEMESCSGTVTSSVLSAHIQSDVCCHYTTSPGTNPITTCDQKGCYQPKMLMQILPLTKMQTCLLTLGPPLATPEEANITISNFKDPIYYLDDLKNPPVCYLTHNDYPKKRTAFILLMIPTAWWGLTLLVFVIEACYFCSQRYRIRIQVLPLTEKENLQPENNVSSE
jgi:hypothetical protein